MVNLLSKRFAELQEEARQLEKSKHSEYNDFLKSHRPVVDENRLLMWKVKAKSLILRVCGKDSQHLKAFTENEHKDWASSHEDLLRMMAVFEAARDDFEGGHLTTFRSLVQAELFDSELDQAKELLRNGYKVPAAVIAGTVLETSLRELCDRHEINHGKLDKMNADLAREGVYNAIQAKLITALAAIRNSAAHGKGNDLKEHEVDSMISDVERFLAAYLS